MKLSQFKYHLPEELIATEPPAYRDEARLMVLDRRKQTIEHKVFKDVVNYFNEHDIMVLNDSGVFPALLDGEKEKTGAKIKVLLLRELNKETRLWDVIVDPARKIRIGNKLYFGDNDELVAEVIDNTTSRGRTIRFLFEMPYDEFKSIIYKYGKTPIPEQLQKLREVKDEDREWYQTIYAEHIGSVAAPFSGLHFSRELMKRLEIVGVEFAKVTLHTGLGNFRSIDVEDLTKHKTDSEEMEISEDVVKMINAAKREKRNICAVGTTSMKVLESATTLSGMLKPYKGWTNKFIFPPYDFTVANSMITNFHTPLSPMLMMTCAFGGYDFIMKAYKVAVEEKYKFFAYGDAMLIL
ncbi:MAG: tRNA preQ1(34) S-adenosylmethionine ribosyltransferase-isomerase QueA [Bacteroidales bacterium]|nr:tRNA preQ1(34) S-adenosylmethionine ribosyltransferase-isomerase QueA [Bacteroidales bacterium]MDD2203779.1 tRNA preQ1(34) S-adenosylmethionine ribosyltransferase-isomerase QueA [Bacteroidales bacterium]MDD3151975.1 tRNA preQ1(34) S-adenosylmethionine ribosyltransferase-isomerase QueA [Bacteroidales bacterium]MDD3913282.1 tRNA preQ1(34) S-adenosylmethionine ribosyltransferase-isomerase QueA [Bacteroidales bacterium]MDD4633313.1 tRNA preQ1(34) S-adenosylmethionine ribosyltransferase-isomerase